MGSGANQVEHDIRTILVVDDDPASTGGAAECLTHHGFRVLPVTSGSEAIDAATSGDTDRQIDLVLLEPEIEQGTGTRVAAEILAKRELPIVLLTSLRDADQLSRIRSIKLYGIIQKGSGELTLLSSVESAFDLFKVDQSLRHERERYQNLVESIHDAIYEIAADGTILYVSRAIKPILGYDPEEFINRSVIEFVHPDDSERLRRALPQEHDENDEPAEFRFRAKNGAYIWCRTQAMVMEGDSPGTAARGSLVNVNDSVTTRLKLEQSERRLERAERIAGVGNWEIDFTTGRVYASTGARRIYGMSDSPLMLEDITAVPLPEYRPLLDEGITRLRNHHEPYRAEFKIKRRDDGTIRDVLSAAEYDTESDTAIGIIEDVTETVRTREEIESNRQYLSAVLDSVNEAVLVKDGETGIIVDANRTASEMYGYSREEFTHLTVGELSSGTPPYTGGELTERLDRARSQQLPPFEWMARARDGTIFPVELSAHFTVIGKEHRYVVTARDITARKATERDVLALLGEKEMILKEVHHRIKNNIAVIGSLLSLQAARTENLQAEAALRQAQARVRTVGALYEKLHRSDLVDRVDAQVYLDDLADEISHALDATGGSVQIERRISSFPLPVRACVPLGLILNELITNAFTHAFQPGTRGIVEVSCTQPGDRIELRVRDNGRGLPAPVDSPEFHGFGLTIVNALVRQLTGTLSVRSDGGAEFVVNCPIEPD